MDFRSVGFTDAAINYPLSLGAARLIAEHNGIPTQQMPEEFWFAPNAYMRDRLEKLALDRIRGIAIRDEDGRWLGL